MPRTWRWWGAVALTGVWCGFVLGCGNGDAFRWPEPDVRYVAFGDSATRGPSSRDYVAYLPGLLGVGDDAVANEGDSGESTDEGLERLRSLIDREIFPNAEVLLYWEGAKDLIDFIEDTDPFLLVSPEDAAYPFTQRLTDALDEIQANIESAIRIGQDAGLRVYVATYFFLPAGSLDCDMALLNILLPRQAANANDYVARLNERIRQAVGNRGATIVDVAAEDAALRADPANYYNCNHLSTEGNRIVAEAFARVIGG